MKKKKKNKRKKKNKVKIKPIFFFFQNYFNRTASEVSIVHGKEENF